MQERTKQGGSVLVFGIVGVLLALAVIGLVFLVQKRADDNLQGPLFELPSLSDDRAGQSGAGDETLGDSSDSSKKETAEEPQAGGNSDSTENEASDAAPVQPPVAQNPSADKPLPQTGPADSLLSGLMLSVLAGLGVAYYRSRSSILYN